MDHVERALLVQGRRRTRQPDGWGTPMPLLHQSITEIPEKELVTRLLRDRHQQDTLFNIKGLLADGARILREVELREFKPELTGEVDILVVPPRAPEQATAIQVKRFKAKISLDDAHLGHPERMRELIAKGIKQANETARLGFSQVYLWIFVLIDTREQNQGRLTYDGADSDVRSRIEHAISPLGLDARVGLMHFEWVQPMDRPPFELGSYGGHLRRLASTVAQPDDLTAWLRTLRS